jgi:LuxR family transcriptional regulator, maltose regulon positive regulatory protein
MTRLPHDATALHRSVLPVLTPRELQVIQLLARQMSTTQISAAMSISVNTVRTRVRQALRKLGTDDRKGTVQTARECGLV